MLASGTVKRMSSLFSAGKHGTGFIKIRQKDTVRNKPYQSEVSSQYRDIYLGSNLNLYNQNYYSHRLNA
jgi:hypothetical protein